MCQKNITTKLLRVFDGLLNNSLEDIWYPLRQVKTRNKSFELISFSETITRFCQSLKVSCMGLGLQHFSQKINYWSGENVTFRFALAWSTYGIFWFPQSIYLEELKTLFYHQQKLFFQPLGNPFCTLSIIRVFSQTQNLLKIKFFWNRSC